MGIYSRMMWSGSVALYLDGNQGRIRFHRQQNVFSAVGGGGAGLGFISLPLHKTLNAADLVCVMTSDMFGLEVLSLFGLVVLSISVVESLQG